MEISNVYLCHFVPEPLDKIQKSPVKCRWGWRKGIMVRMERGHGATDQLSVKDRKVGGFISNHQHQHFVKYCKLRLQPCRQCEVISLQRFRHTDSRRGLWAERSLFLQLSPRLCIQLALGTKHGQITFNASESAECLVNKFISNHFGFEYRRIWNSKLDISEEKKTFL